MADQLLALSILQPWLWAILEGYKVVENRTWNPPRYLLGHQIALHASLGYDAEGSEFIDGTLFLDHVRAESPPKDHCQRGAILGTARIIGTVTPRGALGTVFGPLTDVQADAAAASPWTFGPRVWLLEDVRKLAQPIPCKGSLGLWRVPADVAELVDREAP